VDARVKNEVDIVLKNPRELQHLLPELLERIQLPPQEAAIRGTKYNIPLINALVLYTGSAALGTTKNTQTPSSQLTISCSAAEPSGRMDLFRYLSISLDNEGRYFLFNAIANNLRYPNNHTHYFSMVLLVLFQDAPEEIIQEQITRYDQIFYSSFRLLANCYWFVQSVVRTIDSPPTPPMGLVDHFHRAYKEPKIRLLE